MIRIQDISKRFKIYNRSIDRIHDWIAPGRPARGRPFWALRDITFDVPAGTSLGIVGVNGAGKSTLLKILTQTTVPTSGSFSIDGRVAALLELGVGFHPEFTGHENIRFNGKLWGLSDEELAAKTPSIIDFAELADFMDQPLRTFSSGMAMRLAFAIAASVEPDVLIIDEALAVGDLHFQQKCLARIRRFHESGTTILFVSHDPSLIKSFCDEAILLDGGKLVDRGKPDSVLDYYNALLGEKYRDLGSQAKILRPGSNSHPAEVSPEAGDESGADGAGTGALLSGEAQTGHRTGNFKAAISDVTIRSTGAGGNRSLLMPGTEATISVRVVALERIEDATIGVQIKDRLGVEIYGTNTLVAGHPIGTIEKGRAVEVDFSAPMNLGPGLYSITAAIHGGATHTEICYDWIERAETFQIIPSAAENFTGLCRLQMQIAHRNADADPKELALAKSLRSA